MMKLPMLRIPLPTFETIRIFNFAASAVMLGFAIAAENRWVALFQAFFGGFNFGSGFFCTYQIRAQRAFQGVSEAFQEMADLNSQLIAGKIIMQDGNPEQRPSLH